MLDMLEPVESLRGVGPKTGEILRKAGIRTVGDFFYNLPRDYENYQAPTTIAEIRPGKVVVRGRIEGLSTRRSRRRNLAITEGVIRDGTGAIKVVWFNQGYRVKQFAPDREYYFMGNFEFKNGRYSLISPSATEVAEVDPSSGLAPVYVAHGALKSANFRRLVGGLRGEFAEIPDLLPVRGGAEGVNGARGEQVETNFMNGARGELRRTGVDESSTGASGAKYWPKTGARREALFNAHFPETEAEIRAAREYLGFEELFELILAARLNRRENDKLRATPVKFEAAKIREFVGKLPFRLTGAQRRAAWEIFQDMEKGSPMNRLLQGDVGSGKTMVAALAAYEAILQGGQVAILAPTAILAAQHFSGLSRILEPFGVRVALLTGASKGKRDLKRRIRAGEVDLVVGTHALLTDDTEFRRLVLVTVDEQHRFGVKQRQKLVLKSPSGLAPHFLSMTATPIPRSLQLTLFGDLEVSVLDELPKGRQPIRTEIAAEIEIEERVYPRIREVLAQGQQIYWVCKAIEADTGATQTGIFGDGSPPPVVTGAAPSSSPVGSGSPENVGLRSSMTSVKRRAEKLKRVFPKAEIGILHGKMKPAEKDEIMERFSRGEIQILVATTVVEVGVDVPNATLMVIENAESYGLAQLHQLRGRVGRGSAESFCCLLTSGDMRPTRRLREMEKSSDGFYLAEVDLKLRGPGEIYGELQHGALDLKIASLSDTRTTRRAQKAVEAFLRAGGFDSSGGGDKVGLTKSENMLKYEELRARIKRYQQITTLN